MNILKKIRNKIWETKIKTKQLPYFIKRKYRKIKRFFLKEDYNQHYNFAISCTKRTAYAGMAIKNINSMHYMNPRSKFFIYCDDVCLNYLNDKKIWIDYPQKVEFIHIETAENKSWQEYKTEMLLDASKKDLVCVDADAIWHEEPKLNRDKITFLLVSRKMKDKDGERFLMRDFFKNEKWNDLIHYTTGFLSLPAKFVTPKFEEDCNKYLKIILNEKFESLNQEERDSLHRLAEQIALNIATQINYAPDKITTLKAPNGGPKDTNILQSLYYGCANQILK